LATFGDLGVALTVVGTLITARLDGMADTLLTISRTLDERLPRSSA
jgi:hypothetical protein